MVQQTKAEAESQPFASTTPPGPWQGNTSCTSCRCHTDRDHCVRPSWITLGLGYDSILGALTERLGSLTFLLRFGNNIPT